MIYVFYLGHLFDILTRNPCNVCIYFQVHSFANENRVRKKWNNFSYAMRPIYNGQHLKQKYFNSFTIRLPKDFITVFQSSIPDSFVTQHNFPVADKIFIFSITVANSFNLMAKFTDIESYCNKTFVW